MLSRATRFGIFLFLDSNDYTAQGGQYECLLGAGATAVFRPMQDLFEGLYKFHTTQQDWLFGHVAYDAKNMLELKLSSGHEIKHPFPDLHFFVPEVVIGIEIGKNELFIETVNDDAPELFASLLEAPAIQQNRLPPIKFRHRISHKDYLDKIAALREHIRNGDCYEINFCSEGFCEEVGLDPIVAFSKLNAASPAPFAACYKLNDLYLMCASPERYLSKADRKIIAQPIKGTARRSADPAEDKVLKGMLYNSEKERAENIMIVDLMRNDLARSCEVGSIKVEELFGVYTFPQVHQMISTISGDLKADKTFADALKASFPMGSMTGAPKVKVMELIEQYEVARRGLFAGTVGYISPGGNFDFNVVIRSLFYNATTQYLSYQSGGAITWDSNAQGEWEELRLKAAAIERLFE